MLPFITLIGTHSPVSSRRSRIHRHRRRGRTRSLASVALLLAVAVVATVFLLRASQAQRRTLIQIAGPMTREPKRKWEDTPVVQHRGRWGRLETPPATTMLPRKAQRAGLSVSSPFLVSTFWNIASAGKTLCLLDGISSR